MGPWTWWVLGRGSAPWRNIQAPIHGPTFSCPLSSSTPTPCQALHPLGKAHSSTDANQFHGDTDMRSRVTGARLRVIAKKGPWLGGPPRVMPAWPSVPQASLWTPRVPQARQDGAQGGAGRAAASASAGPGLSWKEPERTQGIPSPACNLLKPQEGPETAGSHR